MIDMSGEDGVRTVLLPPSRVWSWGQCGQDQSGGIFQFYNLLSLFGHALTMLSPQYLHDLLVTVREWEESVTRTSSNNITQFWQTSVGENTEHWTLKVIDCQGLGCAVTNTLGQLQGEVLRQTRYNTASVNTTLHSNTLYSDHTNKSPTFPTKSSWIISTI